MGSVFISHAWPDKPLARKLAETIRKFAIHVWLDEAEIKLGDSLIEKIRAGIDSVDYVVALLSPQAATSEWVKRELDIAMNQEIEGKRIKVLPILAAQCSLPGFLKGKLYADMSTPKRFKQALPLLLDRLGVPAGILSKMARAKSIDELTKHSGEALRIANALRSTDVALRYETLKSMKSYEHKAVVLNPDVLDALLSFLEPKHETHIRLECLRVISFLEDGNFSEKVEPLVDDGNPAIAVRAIQTLGRLKSAAAGPNLLAILREPGRHRLHDACVDFFTTVSVDDDGMALSIVSIIDKWRKSIEGDPGVEVRAVKAMCRQWAGNRDDILIRILSSLEATGERARLEFLEALKEYATAEGLWVRRVEVRERLQEWLRDAIGNGSPSEVAIAWIVGFLWYEFHNETVWKGIQRAPKAQIEAMLHEIEIEGYYINALFDEPADVAALVKVIGKMSDKILRLKLLDLLSELDSTEALKALVRFKYEPKDWKAGIVLESLAKLDKWDRAFDRLLDTAIANKRGHSRVLAVSLLAQLRAGRISIGEALDQFPRGSVASFGRQRLDLVRALGDLKSLAARGDRRRLTNLIARVREDLENGSEDKE